MERSSAPSTGACPSAGSSSSDAADVAVEDVASDPAMDGESASNERGADSPAVPDDDSGAASAAPIPLEDFSDHEKDPVRALECKNRGNQQFQAQGKEESKGKRREDD